ncbi:hypothetical protein ACFPRL_05325 [Pseudoclavibacter helvolus]
MVAPQLGGCSTPHLRKPRREAPPTRSSVQTTRPPLKHFTAPTQRARRQENPGDGPCARQPLSSAAPGCA